MGIGSRNNQHSFSQVPSVNMARSAFDRSKTRKDIIYFDKLTPCYVEEVLPGDTISLKLSLFARLATQLVPIMDNIYLNFYFFFTPNRLVWENWEKFCGSQDNPGDSIDYVIPQSANLNSGGSYASLVDTLYDKMGLPTGIANDWSVNVLPLRGYNLVWNSWFRDENVCDSVVVNTDDGPDSTTNYGFLPKLKSKDYFAGVLPWPQKGSPVSLPLGTSAPVIGTGSPMQFSGISSNHYSSLQAASASTTPNVNLNASGAMVANEALVAGEYPAYGNTGLIADLTNATAATINALRQAFQVQGLLELDARGGTRYVEILKAHFNVISPDFRLQRPEFLGSGRVQINGHPVPQTSATSGSNYQANLAAFSTASSSGKVGFSHSFVEHGYVLGLVVPVADITYQQGLNKMWSRSTRYDFFWPKLQELGEQAVLNGELYFQGTSADAEVFGYQERYAEYRYAPSEICGQFRSSYATPLDYWHMAQEFGSLPTLNETFLQYETPIARALANTDAPQVLMDMWFQVKHVRPMMTYSVPVTLGRF